MYRIELQVQTRVKVCAVQLTTWCRGATGQQENGASGRAAFSSPLSYKRGNGLCTKAEDYSRYSYIMVLCSATTTDDDSSAITSPAAPHSLPRVVIVIAYA